MLTACTAIFVRFRRRFGERCSNGQKIGGDMTHALTGLRTLLGLGRIGAPANRRSRPAPGRNVMMRVTLDAQHVTPLRQALIRDCAGQPWTIRVTPLHGTQRLRLSLYLPRDAVSGAIQRVAHL